MAFFVHPNSCECCKSELDLFAIPPTQTSIESGSYAEYNPISSISDRTPIEFFVANSGQLYLDLANTQVYVKAQILRGNNEAIDNTNQVGPVNLLLQSLFAEVDVKLNDTLVTSTNNTYPYRAYLETLMSYGNDAKESQMTASMFYKDTAGAMDERNPRADDARNRGLIKRQSFFQEGGTVDMIGRLHNDLFFQDKYLLSDVDMRIRLVRSKDTFCLMSAQENLRFKVKIIDCKLYVRKVKISSPVFLAHGKALEAGTAKYPIRRVICKTFTIPRGNLDFSQENLFNGQIPTRLVLGCVDNDAFNGSYAKNPFNFKHYNITQIKVYLDGQNQMMKPLDMNFAQQQYISAYMSMFSGTGKQFQNEGNCINRNDYASGYTLFAFDLTPDLGEEDHFNLIKEGSLRVDLKFANGLPNTINVLAYAEFENVLEIDKARNILFDYSN
jgi:hypothetical protein